ncbi:ABC-type transport system [Bacillus sp. OxB-1]|uniref:hypothetical protein n=1 Tax=Bacillus sp. (strain OxB-1) TaxID=98228 RepID=UPI0005821F71|nr:hypothetical protein [Bacillus sp. OxB-1]BAQ08910.1 ABC-type transport system [Bacillus sp. OxB-1]
MDAVLNRCCGLRIGILFLLALIISGCQTTASKDKNLVEHENSTESFVQPAARESKQQEAVSNVKSDDQSPLDSEEEKQIHLPEDFPLPEDSKITTSTLGMDGGKKKALLIFETEKSMDEVTKMYTDYFDELSEETQIIDEKML